MPAPVRTMVDSRFDVELPQRREARDLTLRQLEVAFRYGQGAFHQPEARNSGPCRAAHVSTAQVTEQPLSSL